MFDKVKNIWHGIKNCWYWVKAYVSVFTRNPTEVAHLLGMLCGLLIIIVPFGAHVANCFTTGSILLLIVGLVFLPYGWIHGLGVVFGWW